MGEIKHGAGIVEDVIARFVTVLTSLGLPGLVIAVLIYRDNQHTKRNNELVDKIIELGNKGVESNANTVASLNQTNATINSLQQTIMLLRSTNAAG